MNVNNNSGASEFNKLYLIARRTHCQVNVLLLFNCSCKLHWTNKMIKAKTAHTCSIDYDRVMHSTSNVIQIRAHEVQRLLWSKRFSYYSTCCHLLFFFFVACFLVLLSFFTHINVFTTFLRTNTLVVYWLCVTHTFVVLRGKFLNLFYSIDSEPVYVPAF